MINVFIADNTCLNEEKLYEDCYENLPLYRRKKIDRIGKGQGKVQSMAAGILYVAALKSFGIDPYKTDIIYDVNEKPYLKGCDNVYFSLSHSKDRAMAVIADRETGCDTEFIGRNRMSVAKRFFCSEEYDYLCGFSDNKQTEEFTRMWTLKESFMKVTGLGMKLKLSDFFISIKDDGTIEVTWENDNRKYFFKEIELNDGYKYSFCTVGEENDVSINKIDIKAFLKKNMDNI